MQENEHKQVTKMISFVQIYQVCPVPLMCHSKEWVGCEGTGSEHDISYESLYVKAYFLKTKYYKTSKSYACDLTFIG